jgi:hypothetical protein
VDFKKPYLMETVLANLNKYGDDIISLVVALACSSPPGGRSKWTVRLLAEEAEKQLNIGPISFETVRKALKKTL